MRTPEGKDTRYSVGDSRSLRVSSAIYIHRPPATVWTLFEDVRKWREWSPICRDCRVAGPGTLEAGGFLTMRLHFVLFTAEVRARLTSMDPSREICWEASHFGVQALHRYTLSPQGEGCILHNEELLSGLRPPLPHIVRAWFRFSNLSLKSLQGIKRLAEQEPQ